MRTTLYENGNTYEIICQIAEEKQSGKNYIYINDVLYEVMSKVKINEITVTNEMSLDIIKELNEKTKQSLLLVHSLINKLLRFKDEYSQKLVSVFNSFLDHKSL